MYINEKLNEFNEYIRFRKVAVIGLGVSNLPLLDYLHDKKANVTIFDDRTIDELSKDIVDKITNYGFTFSFGKNSLEKLNNFDLIFRSPSCLPTKPELEKEAQRGAIITTEIEQLIKMAPCKVIGITGSDGKTTTTTLTARILEDAGYKVYLGGNIGIPLFTKLNEIKPEDLIVLELSSFQLMGMKVSPDISAITLPDSSSYITVPSGTLIIRSSPSLPVHLLLPPSSPLSAIYLLLCLKSPSVLRPLSTIKIISPP